VRDYESLLVFNPDLENKQIEDELGKIGPQIEKMGGKVVSVEHMQRRDLAYEINKHKKGYYVLIQFQGLPGSIKELERYYRLMDSILRSITLFLEPAMLAQKAKALSEKEGEHDQPK